MYEPYTPSGNRGTQKQSQPMQQQQQANYKRYFAAQNIGNKNTLQLENLQLSQQVQTPKTVMSQLQKVQSITPATPFGTQNINKQQITMCPGQSQRQSQYSQQKALTSRVINPSQYSSTSTLSIQKLYAQNMQNYQLTPQNYHSAQNLPSSKSQTVYSNAPGVTGSQTERKILTQQVQKEQQQYTINQQVQPKSHQQPKQGGQQEVSIQRLYTTLQAISIQLHSLTTSYQQSIFQKKATMEELNQQKQHFKTEVENVFNQCRKLSVEYSKILCFVTYLSNGEVGISRAKETSQTEKDVNHMISLIEETYLKFVPNKIAFNQQTIIPITIQNGQTIQNDMNTKNISNRESTFSTHADINFKKSTENLKNIIEESRQSASNRKESRNIYSPIVHTYTRQKEQIKIIPQQEESDIHQYGSTHKEKLNTSPDCFFNPNYRIDSVQGKINNSSKNVTQYTKNFTPQQPIKRQFTLDTAGQVGSGFGQVKNIYMETQPDIPTYEPIFKDGKKQIPDERVKRNTIQNSYNYAPLSTQPSIQQTSQFIEDQFKQVKNFNQLLKDTNQFTLKTTNKDLLKLMDEQKYEQVTEYAYQTLSEIDRQVINMKATVEQALAQTEMTMTKNLLLEIIESLRETVKIKEIDISNRMIQKIQKNTSRLLKDKTTSYSLYLYLQKITNFLKERENIMNTSIQAHEMSLLNQTDHSFWNSNRLDNNDPHQILPIIEKVQSKNKFNPTTTSSSFNFQFFLHNKPNIPSYIPMNEQRRREQEVKQSIQMGVSIPTLESKTRYSVSPIHNASSSQTFLSAQKPVSFQSKLMTESFAGPFAASNNKFGYIQPPEYLPVTSTGKAERASSVESSKFLGARSYSVNSLLGDTFKSNTANLVAGGLVSSRGNKFLEDDLFKQTASISSKTFSTIDNPDTKTSFYSKITPIKNMTENVEIKNNLFKTEIGQTQGCVSLSYIPQKNDDVSSNAFSLNTPSLTERNMLKIQKIASGASFVSQDNIDKSSSTRNYSSFCHFTVPGSKIGQIESKSFSQQINTTNNSSKLDDIINKYKVSEAQKQVQQNSSSIQNISTQKNFDINPICNNNQSSLNKNSSLVSKVSGISEKNVNLQYQSILDKYIPDNTQKNPTPKLNLSAIKNTSIHNDPLPSVQANYDMIISQQQEAIQKASMNYNIQQLQKKFYDLALKIKGQYPKNHKANTVLINQMWENAQNIPETEWTDFVFQQCNAAK